MGEQQRSPVQQSPESTRAIAAYVLATLVVQGASPGAIASVHYANIDFLREDPNVALGVLAMLMQGLICSVLYARLAEDAGSTRTRVLVGDGSVPPFLHRVR